MKSLIRVGAVVLFAYAAAGTASVSAGAQQPSMGPPVVGVGTVHSQPVTTTSQYVGRVQAIDSVALVARVTGYLEQRLFVEGADVKKGQLLYVLEQAPFQAQVLAQQGTLTQAQANIRYASLTLNRQQALLHTPAGEQSTVDSAVATARGNAGSVLTAQGNLQAAQINLDYTEIRSPVDGRISATSVNQGNVVSPTSGTLATIVTQDPMYVSFPVATRDVVTLQKKYADVGGLGAAKIGLLLTNGDNYDQVGKLDYVSPSVAANTDTITLRATVPNPERGGGDQGGVGTRLLVDGAFVTVTISDPHPVTSLVIPRAAVLSDQQGDYVFVLDAQNRAQRVNLKLGDTIDANQVVLSGLADGQRIVVDGVQRVHDGGVVKPAAPEADVTASAAAGGPSPAAGRTAAQTGSGAPSPPAATTSNRQ